MKQSEYTASYERDTFKVMDDAMNMEEVGICITDFHTGQILFMNGKMEVYTSESGIIGTTCKTCRANENSNGKSPCSFCSQMKLIDRDVSPQDSYIREAYVENSGVRFKIINQVIHWANGRVIRVVTFYNLTEKQRIRDQLSDLMFRDRLLGLKNNMGLEQDVQEASVKPSLLLFEVLSMRKINEFYGWEIGNHLLCRIRDLIISANIPNSELYRIGGDKFCLAIDNISRPEIKELAYKMSGLFPGTWEFEHDGAMIKSFNEIAIAIIHSGYIREDESLLSMSERMLARAKERKKVVVYNKKMDKDCKKRLTLEWDLKRCVHENMRGFSVFYQPIINSCGETWCGLEALCRWNSPKLGPTSPAVFIPEVERLELIEEIGLWVLEKAVGECKAWKLDHCDNFVLNVNLSAAQFRDEALAEKIITILQKYDFPGQKLCIEITESTSVTFLNQSLRTIEQLRGYCILVALDDFGTGYSSFSRLKNMPVDIVKIDKMFVSDIENDEYHRYLFHAMTDLAHAANIKLVAEGVERRKQMDILVEDGADYLQGYLFAKPLSPKDLENKLIHFYGQVSVVVEGNYFMGNKRIGNKAIEPA